MPVASWWTLPTNFLSTAACKRSLLTYPRKYEPSWLAKVVLFSSSFFLLPCLYWFFFSCFSFSLSVSVEGPPYHLLILQYSIHDHEALVPDGCNGKITVVCWQCAEEQALTSQRSMPNLLCLQFRLKLTSVETCGACQWALSRLYK